VTAADPLSHAQALIDAGRHGQALRALGPHLAGNPDDVKALCLASRALVGEGQYQEALKTASRAAALAPGDDWALRLVALSSSRLHLGEQAVHAATAAVRASPNHWQTHYQLAQCLQASKYPTIHALEPLAHALRLGPNEGGIHRLSGSIHEDLHQLPLAQESYRRALAINPDDAIARHELARLSLRRGRLAAAADGFSSAVAMDPTLSIGIRNLDLVISRLLRIAYLLVAIAALIQPHIGIPAIVAGVATVVLSGSAIWFWRAAGRRLGRYLRALPRRSPLLALFAVMLLVAMALLWAGALAPAMASAGPALALVVLLASQLPRWIWLTRNARR
jgi:tetratricopeptide (TPR) repeat protein